MIFGTLFGSSSKKSNSNKTGKSHPPQIEAKKTDQSTSSGLKSFVLYDQNAYIPGTIARINAKYGFKIVYVNDPAEIETYLKTDLEASKIGFVVKAPGFLGQSSHHSPIYFERRDWKEYFVQFDSLMGAAYVLPKNKDLSVERFFYYSPFQRQIADEGCFEDAVNILVKCFQEKDLVEFCQKNSKVEEDVIKAADKSEHARYQRLNQQYKLDSDEPLKLSPVDKKFTRLYQQKKVYLKIKESLEKLQREPIALQQLISLPARFLTNIEHYGTVRHFREHEPDKFNIPYKKGETVGEHMLRKGSLRVAKKSVIEEYKHQDLKGQDFLKRKASYILKDRHHQILTKHPKISKEEIAKIVSEQIKRETQSKITAFRNSDRFARGDDFVLSLLSLPAEVNLNQVFNKAGMTPLQVVVNRFGTVAPEMVKEFLRRGVDINHQDTDGRTVLMHAADGSDCRNETAEMTKTLLEAGARADIQDSEGKTALFYANLESTKMLLKAAPELVKVKDNYGQTALMSQIYGSHCTLDCIKLLIEAKIDVNVQTTVEEPRVTESFPSGMTALHKAAFHDESEIVKILLQTNPALRDVVDSKGRTALDIAKEKRHHVCIAILQLDKVNVTKAAEIMTQKGFGADFSRYQVQQSQTEQQSRLKINTHRPSCLI